MLPGICLALWTASECCQFMCSLSATSTLNSFSFSAILNSFIPQSVLIWGVASAQVEHLALGFMRFPWTYFLSLSRSLWMAVCPPGMSPVPFSVVLALQLAEGALNATVYVIDEDKKLCSSQSSGHHLSLISVWTLSHCPLQPISHLPNSPSIKSISLQFREKGVVRYCVKGLTNVQIALPLSTDVVPSSEKATGAHVSSC